MGFVIIAHRGASAVAPESTKAAILAAVRAGADMIELDVQMTRDSRLVIFHDERVERTTHGSGRLSQMRYAELVHLEQGAWFGQRFAGERILLVSQVAPLIPQKRVRINFELKSTTRRRALIAQFLRVIRGSQLGKRLLISSFDSRLLQPLMRRRLACALLCHEQADRSLQRAIQLGCDAWHPIYTLATPRRVARAHAAGLRVHIWTVDHLPLARHLLRIGVDGIVTNDPARLRALRRP